MRFLEIAWQAQLHREVYIAMLNSALRAWGSKRRFAERVGISPQYLSYLCDPYNIRTPSVQLAQKIADILPISLEQRKSLLEHMLSANERRLQLNTFPRSGIHDCTVESYLVELRRMHQMATFSGNAPLTKIQYGVIREISITLIKNLDPIANPLAFVELCLLLSEVQCVLDRPDSALYYAKIARSVMESADPSDFWRDRERFESFQINAILAEAVAYHNLKLFDNAYDCCLQAEATEAMKHQPKFWKPHLYRDKINALIGKPRFTLGEAEGLANRVRDICTQRAGEFDPLLELLINRSLGQAYIQYGNLKKAHRLLQTLIDQMETTPHVGALHKVLLLRTFASLLWKQNALSDWKSFIKSARDIATEAGLHHQIHEIEQEYGPETISALSEESQGTGYLASTNISLFTTEAHSPGSSGS
ncbi:MAG: helix-turn-helix domain-containing protein [Anaerolineae bacterium]|nr:helix-turn-helix domain-containing protein [Anaerolineae bacterium]MDW8070919.1 helix-turn-helix transcriptional regulator [Anaerolineae bacterium]